MQIYPTWLNEGEGGGGDTVYIEVPCDDGIQGGRPWKQILVTAKVKMKRKKKKFKVLAKLLR